VLKALSVERARLQALPKTRSNDYEELDARVSKFALIWIKHVLYSVPSRLIGHRLVSSHVILTRFWAV